MSRSITALMKEDKNMILTQNRGMKVCLTLQVFCFDVHKYVLQNDHGVYSCTCTVVIILQVLKWWCKTKSQFWNHS